MNADAHKNTFAHPTLLIFVVLAFLNKSIIRNPAKIAAPIRTLFVTKPYVVVQI